jgi:hypothetical protein
MIAVKIAEQIIHVERRYIPVEIRFSGETVRITEDRGDLLISSDLKQLAAMSTGGVNVLRVKVIDD